MSKMQVEPIQKVLACRWFWSSDKRAKLPLSGAIVAVDGFSTQTSDGILSRWPIPSNSCRISWKIHTQTTQSLDFHLAKSLSKIVSSSPPLEFHLRTLLDPNLGQVILALMPSIEANAHARSLPVTFPFLSSHSRSAAQRLYCERALKNVSPNH